MARDDSRLTETWRPIVGDRLILCTGGTGYLGGALIQRLSSKGLRVRAYDSQHFGDVVANFAGVESIRGDVLDPIGLESAMRDVTDVIHLAGIVTDGLVDLNAARAAEVNLLGTYNVARACREVGVRRLVYASSSSVYGHAAAGTSPVTEDVAPLPMTAYAWQKLAGEAIVNSLAGGGLSTVSVRSATAMGPAPRMRLDTVVNAFSKQAWFDGRITVHGGSQYRSNVHVEDVCRLYELLLDADSGAVARCAFNATHGNQSVASIAREVQLTLKSRWGRTAEVVRQDVKDRRSYRMDATLAKTVLGWSTERSIATAAQDCFKWFDSGGVLDPNDPIYFNTRRMRELMEEKA